jgi:hypothetical protein
MEVEIDDEVAEEVAVVMMVARKEFGHCQEKRRLMIDIEE